MKPLSVIVYSPSSVSSKIPGSDRLPKEFYVKFSDLLARTMPDLYNFSFAKGFLRLRPHKAG